MLIKSRISLLKEMLAEIAAFLCMMGLFLFFTSAVLLAGTGKDAIDIHEEIAKLKFENSILDEKVQLAKSGKFYLIADLPARKIHLMIRGVPVKTFAIEHVEVGRRAFFFLPLSSNASFNSILPEGAIHPPRVVERYQIVPPPPEEVARRERMSEEEIPPPLPTPETKQIDVPPIFKLIFEGGFAVEIVSTGIDKESPGFFERLKARFRTKLSDIASIFQRGRDVKLRVSMRADDFRNFYRAVPDQIDMILITMPPGL